MQFEFKQGIVTATRIFDSTNPNDGTLYRIRVQPDMVNIPDTDIDLLPWYPNFFKGDHTAHQINDVVWLLVNDDFDIGFILGGAQSASGDDISAFIQIINVAEQKAGLQLSAYDQLHVTQVGGTSVSFTNPVLGQAGTIYNNKIVCIYGSDGSMWYNNPGLTAIISPAGDLNIKGKSKTEEYTTSSITTTNESTEDVGTKRIDSAGKMVLTTGGTFEKHVSSGNTEWIGGDDDRNVLGTRHETIVGGDNKTIALGNSSTTVAAGTYEISVLLGAINIFASLPISFESTTSISFTAPLVSLLGEIVDIGTFLGAINLNALAVSDAFGQVLSPSAPPGSGGFVP